MNRDPASFARRVPELRALWFATPICGKRHRLATPLLHALETAYCAGALETLGAALGWPDDDVRQRALELQQQVAARLAQLQEETQNVSYTNGPLRDANREVKRRMRNQRFD